MFPASEIGIFADYKLLQIMSSGWSYSCLLSKASKGRRCIWHEVLSWLSRLYFTATDCDFSPYQQSSCAAHWLLKVCKYSDLPRLWTFSELLCRRRTPFQQENLQNTWLCICRLTDHPAMQLIIHSIWQSVPVRSGGVNVGYPVCSYMFILNWIFYTFPPL